MISKIKNSDSCELTTSTNILDMTHARKFLRNKDFKFILVQDILTSIVFEF